ncbi:MAG: DUF5680 domain-containing protein [Candidatus Moranbacteria bacterium]|nr:DUF5680 domain-containing protein [Candidatus Moranbacteria bacterium]
MNNLKKFIIKAKINTYASNGEGGEKRLSDGSKELSFKEGDLLYVDRYYGSDPFSGEEVVFESSKAVWIMNYYGKCLGGEVLKDEIYSFLKKALREVDFENPYRGPLNFCEGDLYYKNKVNGNFEYFHGEEKIFYGKKLVYELTYHGGRVV